jgi:hypothetical protein
MGVSTQVKLGQDNDKNDYYHNFKPHSRVNQEQSLGHGLGESARVDLFFF